MFNHFSKNITSSAQALWLAVPLGTFIFFTLWLSSGVMLERSIRSDLDEHVKETSTHHSQVIEKKLHSWIDDLTRLSRNDLLLNGLIELDAKSGYLQMLFRSMEPPGPVGGRITLTDYRGRTIATNKPGNSHEKLDGFDQVIDGKPLVRLDRHGLLIAIPVFNYGSAEGAVIVEHGRDKYSQLFATNSEDVAILVISPSGYVLYSSNEALASPGDPDPGSEVEGWVLSRRPLSQIDGVTITSAESISHAFEPVENLRAIYVVDLFLNLGAMIFIVTLVIRIVTRPISHISDKISKIEATGDLSARLHIKGPREVTHLAESFNAMTTKIEASSTLMRHHAEFVESIFSAVPTPLLVHRNGIVTTVNMPFIKTFNVALQEVENKHLVEALCQTGLPRKIIKSLKEGEPLSNGEVECRTSGGRILTLAISQTALVSDDDKKGQDGFLILLNDISWRKSAEEEKARLEQDLREAHKLEAVGLLAGGIAHEINTPAQYIGDNLRFLEKANGDLISVFEAYRKLCEKLEPDCHRESFDALEEASRDVDLDFILEEIPAATRQSIGGIEHISTIIRAMKEFSHPGSKESVLTDINEMLRNVMMIARNEWMHFAELELDLSDDLPHVPCHLAELNQVFLNLIVNAAHSVGAKHNQAMGEIRISSMVKGDAVRIEVADNGDGIAENIRHKIFLPFFTTKDVGKGTGQGLSLSRDIVVKKHHGKIGCTNNEEGGATFFVELPIEEADEEAMAS